MAEEFWKAYKHPLWQKKRLEIMQLAGFKCERCRSSDDTLNVHHAYYERGKKPWEYPTRAARRTIFIAKLCTWQGLLAGWQRTSAPARLAPFTGFAVHCAWSGKRSKRRPWQRKAVPDAR